MNVGVTGASGFVGSRLRTYLRNEGHEVFRLGRTRPESGDPNFVPFTLEAGVDPAVLDPIDALVHLAYDFGPNSWEEIVRVNVEGTIDLFDAADAAGTDVVQVSTLSAYEGCRSKYGRAKLVLEEEAFDRGYRVIRPGLVFGRDAGNVVGSLRTVVGLSPLVPVPSGGPYVHYLCHYEDLSELLEKCCTGDVPRFDRPVVAASERALAFRTILRTMAEANGRSLRFVPVPSSLVLYGLRSVEAVGLDVGLRSDSVIGLIHPDENPDFGPTRRTGVTFRDFTPETLDEGFTEGDRVRPSPPDRRT